MPGLDFYRAIGESNFNLNTFGTFIPDTLVSMQKLTWIQWIPGSDESSGTNLRRDNDFVLLNYAEHLKNLEISLYGRNPTSDTDIDKRPIAIEKKLNDSYFDCIERTMSWSHLN
jgi:hypothetical protein